jgi:ribonuclease-3 family protein
MGYISLYKLGQKMDSQKAKNLNAVVLAFVGDAVFSLFVREKLTFNSDLKTNQLNKLATAEVKATAQAELIKQIMPLLNEEELAIFKRARNAKKTTKAKHATVAEYNASTGFEAVVGYLHLIGDNDRLNFLLNKGIEDED